MLKARKSPIKSPSKKRPRGRQKGVRISVHAPNIISALKERLGLSGEILTYQDLASVLTIRAGMSVTRAEAWRIAHDPNGHTPTHKNNIRAALGLPCYAPAPVCPTHGVVHIGACPKTRKTSAYRDLWDWPAKSLATAIRNRQ